MILSIGTVSSVLEDNSSRFQEIVAVIECNLRSCKGLGSSEVFTVPPEKQEARQAESVRCLFG